ncbi:hypothetical protein CULT_1170017 [[Clostridium] ultunense Esp]|nr:hypothetical protein CULT_1170017 [[Clostridium] ultunense Esp]
MSKKERWKEVENKYFINPYNFISLSNGCTRETSDDEDKEDSLTGYIQCTLIPKTPIFIPNTSNDNAFNLSYKAHKSFDFYSYTDLSGENGKKVDCKRKYYEPVIPGSSIRGVIRSAFEAVTNSCLSTIDDNYILYKRVPPGELTGSSGLLIKDENEKIELFETERYMLKYKRCKGDRNFISYSEKPLSKKLFTELLRISFLNKKGNKVYISSYIKNNKIDVQGFNDKETKLLYHCKMTEKEKRALLEEGEKIKGEKEKKEFKGIIKELYRKSEKFHDIDDFEEGYKVYIKVGDSYKNLDRMPKTVINVFRERPNSGGFRKGVLLKGEDFFRKHHISVLDYDGLDKENPIEVEEDNIKYQLDELLKIYQDLAINKGNTDYKKWYEEYKDLFYRFMNENRSKIILPVFFRKIGENIYLSPACVTKEVYYNKIADLIKDYSLCNNENNLCEACRLFGNLNGDKVGVASKVRFTDAIVKNKVKDKRNYYVKTKSIDGDDSLLTLKELSSPKISATEFYIDINGDSSFYTYDYYKIGNKKYKLYKPNIRGRKMYWHNCKLKDDIYLDTMVGEKPSKFNITIRPLNTKYLNGESIEFNFRVYFEGISKSQLDKLISILNLGNDKNEQEDKNKRLHKIGMGKPLGLGSVEIKVDDIKLRKIAMDENRETIKYRLESYEREPNFTEVFSNDRNKEALEEFLRITIFCIDEFYTKNVKISYPIATAAREGKNKKAGYQWFIANTELSKRYKLPKIKDNVKLPELEKR